MDPLPQKTINLIRQHCIAGKFNGARLARELGIAKETLYKYRREFRKIARLYPLKLHNFSYRLAQKKKGPDKSPNYELLLEALPALVDATPTPTINVTALWQSYRKLYPQGYHIRQFRLYYGQWKKQHGIHPHFHRRIKSIPPEDLAELQHWKSSSQAELWRKAIALNGSLEGRPIKDISTQIERIPGTVMDWIKIYQEQGLERLRKKRWTPCPRQVDENRVKREKLFRLLQQTPRLHGFNRTSWTFKDLAIAYGQYFGSAISISSVRFHLRQMGYRLQKSCKRLTSPDPMFREKLDRIKAVLAGLSPFEKFFSIDEYGPAAVKMRTGWSYTAKGQTPVIPQQQTSKGWYILIAALELSTNQITHFYTRKKDSAAMILLIETLLERYRQSHTLYLSWDCASWHNARAIRSYLDTINTTSFRSQHGTPAVEITPLPTSAQYLNVIESVFSGMAKAVIHNSNYASLEDCLAAIDSYFQQRNAYFRAHPQRAGKKLWGMEPVIAVFSETHNCRRKGRPQAIPDQ